MLMYVQTLAAKMSRRSHKLPRTSTPRQLEPALHLALLPGSRCPAPRRSDEQPETFPCGTSPSVLRRGRTAFRSACTAIVHSADSLDREHTHHLPTESARQ